MYWHILLYFCIEFALFEQEMDEKTDKMRGTDFGGCMTNVQLQKSVDVEEKPAEDNAQSGEQCVQIFFAGQKVLAD